MNDEINLSKKTVDYIFVIGIILIFIIGFFAVYNNLKYLHEARTHPCKLCTDLGYLCTEPYRQEINFIIPNETEIYTELGTH